MNSELYNKNSEALRKVNTELAKKIHVSADQKWIEMQEDKKNFIVKKSAKVQLAYPKLYKKEVNLLGKQKIYFKDTATIIIGMGCGHLVKAITKNMDKGHRVIVIEPVMQLIRDTFHIYDFSKLIASTEMIIATTEEETSLAISMFNEILVVQDWLTVIEPYVMMCEEYADLMSYANQLIDQIRCNVGTVAGAGNIIAENDIKNIPYIIKHRGIKDLKNLYKNKPAILIATGAAINNNIHMLKDIQDKAIIISIAQGLRMLLGYDVQPDFITTVDYGEINYEHFKGLMDEDVPLVALNRTYAPILKHWQGTKFIAGTYMPGFEETATGIIQKKGCLESGGSVVHLSFQFAKLLGCNPIIFLGHGYSFGKGLSHTEQVDSGGKIDIKEGLIKWKVHDPRSQLKDKDQFQGGVVYLPGIFGEPSPVNVGLASFVTTFEAMFKASTEKIINASEEGTDMKGTINMTFQKVTDLYLTENIDKTKIKSFLNFDPNSEKDIDEIIPKLKTDINNLKNLVSVAKNGLTCADDMIDYKNDKKMFKQSSDDNQAYSNETQKYAKMNPLVAVAIYGVNRRIYGRDLKVKGTGKDLIKNLETRVKRNKMILEAAKEAGEKLIPMYEEVYNILENYKQTKDISLLQHPIKEKIKLRDAKKYFKVGNWSHPLVDSRKKIAQNRNNFWIEIKKELGLFEYGILYRTIDMRMNSIGKARHLMEEEKRQDKLDYHQAIQEAHKLGKEKKKYKESLRILQKAKKLFPKKLSARWGIASTLILLKKTDEAIKEYESLIKDFSDNYRMQFEYGIALVDQRKFNEAIAIFDSVMSKTNEFNHFYRNLGKLYELQRNKQKAKESYRAYLKSYPADYEITQKLKNL